MVTLQTRFYQYSDKEDLDNITLRLSLNNDCLTSFANICCQTLLPATIANTNERYSFKVSSIIEIMKPAKHILYRYF